MAEKTNKEKLDELLRAMGCLQNNIATMNENLTSKIKEIENIVNGILVCSNIMMERFTKIENNYSELDKLNTTVKRMSETQVSLYNNITSLNDLLCENTEHICNTIENGTSYQSTTAALNELHERLKYMTVEMHMSKQSQDDRRKEYLELLDVSKKINQAQANTFNFIQERTEYLEKKTGAVVDPIQDWFESVFTGIDDIKNLIVDQEKSINDKIENCNDNSIDYIAEKYNSLFTGVCRLLTNAVDTKEKIDEISKDNSKKDEIKCECEDNSYKIFCENLEKIYNRKIDFSIYSQDTINWIAECKDDSSNDLDLLNSIVRCHIGSIREIYIDGEPYKFIKINEESKVSFIQGVPFTDIFHDYVCIDFPKLLQFGSSYDYKTSNVRKWINNEFIQMIEPGVVKYMEIQEVESDGEILMDYVKIPSCTEIGYINCENKEGTCYNALNPMVLNRNGYWLRTSFSIDNVYSINDNNSAVIYTNNQSALHIVPIIRIKESKLPYET